MKTEKFIEVTDIGRSIGIDAFKFAFEGVVCKPVVINGKKITYREMECLKHLGKAEKDKQIQKEMNFKGQASVNSLMVRLRNKMEVTSRSEMIIQANRIGII